MLVGLVALAVAIVLTWIVWPDPTTAPRERQYRDVTACLLTDNRGLASRDARAAWTGMQRASVESLVQVQYLAANGVQDRSNVAAYFNTLAAQGCEMVIAVGVAPVDALIAGKDRFPAIRYVVVGGAPNVGMTIVEAGSPDEIVEGVAAAVRTLPAST
ncbi:hypothetical protein ACN263_10940 [Micromonospora sp. WMMD729]|uniref:hypothetical protein n=1 Tax=Micromonospora sp. WMMD729 TaxID=3404127 RepID=UPI003BF4A728